MTKQERMAFDDNMTVLYLCDRQKCKVCHYDVCHHTTDVSHAVNFKKLDKGFWEDEVNDTAGT